MAALPETYVDPSLNSNTGAGTITSPYGDLQWALNNMTVGSLGNRINIKAGTAEFMTTALGLDLTTYGTPGSASPLVFQGYRADAGDGGIGVLDGAGSYSIMNASTVDYISFIDLTLQDCGTVAHMVYLDRYISIINCIFQNHNGTHALRIGAVGNYIIGSTFTDITGTGILGGMGHVYRCKFIEGATYKFSGTGYAILFQNYGASIIQNIIKVSGSAGGIYLSDGVVNNNSIYSNGGTGKGLRLFSVTICASNNVIEGFSGSGGIGINYSGGYFPYSDGNSVYDCETSFDGNIDRVLKGDKFNETLSSTPFNDAVNADFTPNEIGFVREGTTPPKVGNA